MIITIDGPAGTGKSTVAKGLAQKLGYMNFETGAMYRAFTLFSMRKQVEPMDEKGLESLVEAFVFDIQLIEGNKRYFMGGEDVTEEIRSREVTQRVSVVAAFGKVRQGMVRVQREYGKGVQAIFEGRDLGTVVFPQAELKIYLDASAEIRARRRLREIESKHEGPSPSFEEVLGEINHRDQLDKNRDISPLKQAEDAILIDTSHLTVDEVIAEILSLHQKVGGIPSPHSS